MFHLSGRPCLDLANTVSWRRSQRPIERLSTYADLIDWARQGRWLTPGEVRALAQAARRQPARAARVLARACRLREALYRIFSGLAGGGQPASADLAHLDRELRDAFRNVQLRLTRAGATLAWSCAPGDLARPIWIAARSAAEILTTDNLRRLKTCPSSTCGWLFLDTTKNGTRRWCDMRVCGSRAKARTYYASRVARRRQR